MNLTAETAAKVAATKHQDFFRHNETKWCGSNLREKILWLPGLLVAGSATPRGSGCALPPGL